MPTPRQKGSASAIVVPGRVEIAREQHDLNDDRRDAGAGQQRGDRAHAEREEERAAALVAGAEAAREAREVDER